jgi:hypothetical protein
VPGPQGDYGPQGPAGPQGAFGGPQGPQGADGVPGLVTVNHGTDGTIARPACEVAYWVGTALPLNALPTDLWYGSSSSQPQSYVATLTQAEAYTDTAIAALPAKYVSTDNPAVGEFVPRRSRLNGITNAQANQTLFGPCFLAEKTETISNVTVYTGSTAAAATPTLIQIGVYSIDASGNAVLVASTPNDTTLLSATRSQYPKAFSSSFTKTAGQRYWVAILVVSGSAQPNFVGWVGPDPTNSAFDTIIFGALPTISYKLTGQTSLPPSISSASLSAGVQNTPLFRLS